MKKAISRVLWVDMTDDHEYQAGDAFPHDGREIPEKRMTELSTDNNGLGFPVIELVEVEEPKKKK